MWNFYYKFYGLPWIKISTRSENGKKWKVINEVCKSYFFISHLLQCINKFVFSILQTVSNCNLDFIQHFLFLNYQTNYNYILYILLNRAAPCVMSCTIPRALTMYPTCSIVLSTHYYIFYYRYLFIKIFFIMFFNINYLLREISLQISIVELIMRSILEK